MCQQKTAKPTYIFGICSLRVKPCHNKPKGTCGATYLKSSGSGVPFYGASRRAGHDADNIMSVMVYGGGRPLRTSRTCRCPTSVVGSSPAPSAWRCAGGTRAGRFAVVMAEFSCRLSNSHRHCCGVSCLETIWSNGLTGWICVFAALPL